MMVYLGLRPVVMLNTRDVIREAFVKRGLEFSGRPQDQFWVEQFSRGFGNQDT